MFSISKTTENYAAKRGLYVDLDLETNYLWIYEANEETEPLVMYEMATDGAHYQANIYLTKETNEELPAWIRDEKHLREVLNFLKTQN